jgi:hypothetical protein
MTEFIHFRGGGGYGLDSRGSRIRFPAGAGNFSLHLLVQNGSGAHPASYPMGTRGSFPGGKVAGAWSWPLTSAEVKEWEELYFHSLSTPSWRGAQLKAEGQLYLLPLGETGARRYSVQICAVYLGLLLGSWWKALYVFAQVFRFSDCSQNIGSLLTTLVFYVTVSF